MKSTLRFRTAIVLAVLALLSGVAVGQAPPVNASTGTDAAPTVAKAATVGTVDVYRFWSERYQGHFYTASTAERDRVIATWPDVWTYEGPRYKAFATQVSGTVPLYRFWSTRYNGHFYTAEVSERDQVRALWPDVWSYEGVAYYVYPPSSTAADAVPVYRFWSDSAHHHFYTASEAEKNHVNATWPNVWSFEGPRFRVPADAPTDASPPAPPSNPSPTTPPTPPTGNAGFPSASNTGVPAGTALSAYTGPCTITTAGTVIDAKTVNCSLTIRAKDVSITRSLINGTVYGDTDGRSSFAISDSQVNIGDREGTGIGDAYFTATRVHVTGGNRSINCFLNCTIERSYVHGQFRDATGRAHESGIRMGSGSVIRGNTITCDAPDVPPDAGCSAGLTGYGDFATVQNNVIDGNLFLASTGGFCAYGGSTQGKPYSAGVNGIQFTNNVFQRGPGGKCGTWGAITSFDSRAPGNGWSNNTWDDGTAVRPAN